MELAVLVPRPGSPLAERVAPGSGIVGSPAEGRPGHVVVPAHAVIPVGTYDPATRCLRIGDRAALARWLGASDVPKEGLEFTAP